MRNKILFIAPLPDPITGQSLASKILLQGLISDFDVEVVNLSKSSFMSGDRSIVRAVEVIKVLITAVLKGRNADIIYLTISESVAGNLKDLILYVLLYYKLGSFVIHLHGGSFYKAVLKKPFLGRINQMFLNQMRYGVVLGETHRVNLGRVMAPEKIRVVNNFAEDYLFANIDIIRAKFDENAQLRVLYISNFIEGKGYKALLEGYEMLDAERQGKISVDFCGAFDDAEAQARFLTRIARYERISFHGVVTGDEKRAKLHGAHVFCLPTTLSEGQPISILEAYAAGCVVLTTNSGGIYDVFQPESNGFEIARSSAESIKNAFERCLDDRRALGEIGLRNFQYSRAQFREERFQKEMIDLLRTAERPRGIAAERSYQVCTRCVSDTSDPSLTFDHSGICAHCRDFERNIYPRWRGGKERSAELAAMVDQIKQAGRKSEFDCILGLSGGMDSSYMLHVMVKEFGLRPLVFHVDGGWNSELAVHNINRLVDGLGVELYTEVVNWDEMRAFQLACFKAGIPHIDMPQDHAFVAVLYKYAAKYKIKYILNGGNVATECVKTPLKYFYYGTDMFQIRDIIRQYGDVPMSTYPFSSVYWHKIYLRFIRGVSVVRPLNYMDYQQDHVARVLEQAYGWRRYPQKHFESRFTKFYEGFWLPTRFGFDVRRVQMSCLILTGQITRDQALAILKRPALDDATIKQEFRYIASKLEISEVALQYFLEMPRHYYWDYSNQHIFLELGERIMNAVGLGRRGGAI